MPHFHPCLLLFFALLVSQGLSELLSPRSRSLDGGVDDLVEPTLLQHLQAGEGGTVGASDVLAQLSGRLWRLGEHLAGAQAGLGGQAGGLLLGEAEGCGAGDEVLDHGEEVCGAGA